MKIVELIMDDSGELGVNAISLVETPAIESDFVAFNAEDKVTFAAIDEKRIILGAALIPNKPIARKNTETGELYYVYMSPDTVRKAGERYLTQDLHHNVTINHEKSVEGVVTVESWFKEFDNDKSTNYGIEAPIGTWFVSKKVNNDDVWNDIKSGKVKGFSIEAYFTTPEKMDMMSELEALLSSQK